MTTKIHCELADEPHNVTLSFKLPGGGRAELVFNSDKERLAQVLAILQAPPPDVTNKYGLRASGYGVP